MALDPVDAQRIHAAAHEQIDRVAGLFGQPLQRGPGDVAYAETVGCRGAKQEQFQPQMIAVGICRFVDQPLFLQRRQQPMGGCLVQPGRDRDFRQPCTFADMAGQHPQNGGGAGHALDIAGICGAARGGRRGVRDRPALMCGAPGRGHRRRHGCAIVAPDARSLIDTRHPAHAPVLHTLGRR